MAKTRLNLFGFPQAHKDDQNVTFKTRKTLALLIYLALEPGWHSRDKLAGLLWPEADQDQGRGSLRKSLTLMRQALGDAFPLVAEKERIRLEPTRISTDLARLNPEADDLPPEWLEGVLRDFSLPDTAPFEEWIEGQRKVLQERLDKVVQAQMLRQQAQGQADAALRLAKSRIALDPFGEEAHLEMMRLLCEQGRSGQALEVFRTFRKRLWDEYRAYPSLEMVRLVQGIQGHTATLMRPTLSSERGLNQVPLLGREREWALMEGAWAKGQAILISGAAGVGKSRLALEFCVSKGSTLRVWARRGDDGIPYATHARNFAQVFLDQPEVAERLPDWIRSEMARMIPWIGHPPGHPIRDKGERDRFLSAKVEVNRMMAAERGWDMFLYDDAQFTDSATMDISFDFQRHLLPSPPGVFRSVFAFRHDEMPERYLPSLQSWVDDGLAVWIRLEPLPPDAVTRWLSHRSATALAPNILRLTGGNPLFIHETLQALGNRPQGESGGPLPRSQHARQILGERLGRLSAEARAVTHVAASSGSDFSLDAGGWVPGLDPETLTRAAEELQRAGIFKGQAFSHDLLYEAALEDIPPESKAGLCARIARYLEATQPYIAPARLARYYLDGNQPQQAVGHLLEAGRQAVDTFVLDQAADWYELAAKVLGGLNRVKEAAEALGQATKLRSQVS